MTKPFWTIPKKIALTILLAFLASWLFGCAEPRSEITFVPVPIFEPTTDIPYLQTEFITLNNAYFDGKLATPEIIFQETPAQMATTTCLDGHCVLTFNFKYVLAPRVADLTMLHEMCHIKTWGELEQHGRQWRTCMLGLDQQGALRHIIIDNYKEVQ